MLSNKPFPTIKAFKFTKDEDLLLHEWKMNIKYLTTYGLAMNFETLKVILSR
jgi:hypothetical protein